MPLAETIAAGTEALSLTTKLVELIKASKKSGTKPALLELLGQLEVEAVRISRQFGARARELMESLSQLDVDLNKSIPELLRELNVWFNWRTRSKLKDASSEFYGLHQRLTQFLDDVTGVMICAGNVSSAANAYVEGLETKQKLDRLMLSNPPIRAMLEEMIAVSDRLFAQLEGGPASVGEGAAAHSAESRVSR
jgi:hypothetical protein